MPLFHMRSSSQGFRDNLIGLNQISKEYSKASHKNTKVNYLCFWYRSGSVETLDYHEGKHNQTLNVINILFVIVAILKQYYLSFTTSDGESSGWP